MQPDTFVLLFVAGTGLLVLGALVTVVVVVVRALSKRKRPSRPGHRNRPRFSNTDSESPSQRTSFSDTRPSSDTRDGSGVVLPAFLGAAAVAVGDALLPEVDRSSDDGGGGSSSSDSDSSSSSSSDDSSSSSSSD